mmetsp:Transcript_75881/g.202896  ORF Transcript_75881/g.202896 Transcript_75881/m.202896 type:complete len:154 (+) Transcript_75881:74-535(+)
MPLPLLLQIDAVGNWNYIPDRTASLVERKPKRRKSAPVPREHPMIGVHGDRPKIHTICPSLFPLEPPPLRITAEWGDLAALAKMHHFATPIPAGRGGQLREPRNRVGVPPSPKFLLNNSVPGDGARAAALASRLGRTRLPGQERSGCSSPSGA